MNGKKWSGKGYIDENNVEKKYAYKLEKGKGYLKEFNENNELIFEGEYLNGEKNGKGKEYDKYRLIFDGEYLNGKRNGKGKEYYSVKEIYDVKENEKYNEKSN